MKISLKSALCAVCVICVSHVQLMATPTNGTAIMTMTNPPVNDSVLVKAEGPAHTWREIWRDNFLQKSDIYSSDSVGWRAVGASIYAQESGVNPRTYFAHAGENAIKHSLVNSFRDSVVQLPVVFNLRDVAGNLPARFFADSIGHTPEESIQTLNTTPTASQISWWQEMRNDKTIEYGWRPFNSNYAYVDGNFGHLDDGPLGTALVRVRYDPIHLWSKVEEQVSFFFSENTSGSIGGNYTIADINNSNHEVNWSASLSHTFGKDWYTSPIASISLSTNDHTYFMSAQVNWPF